MGIWDPDNTFFVSGSFVLTQAASFIDYVPESGSSFDFFSMVAPGDPICFTINEATSSAEPEYSASYTGLHMMIEMSPESCSIKLDPKWPSIAATCVTASIQLKN